MKCETIDCVVDTEEDLDASSVVAALSDRESVRSCQERGGEKELSKERGKKEETHDGGDEADRQRSGSTHEPSRRCDSN